MTKANATAKRPVSSLQSQYLTTKAGQTEPSLPPVPDHLIDRTPDAPPMTRAERVPNRNQTRDALRTAASAIKVAGTWRINGTSGRAFPSPTGMRDVSAVTARELNNPRSTALSEGI